MRQGHKRDAEIKAMYDYAMWISDAWKAHPDDDELFAYHRRVCLIALRELTAEMAENNRPNNSLVDDRIADCMDCDRNGKRGCFDEQGRYIGCKWFDGKNKVEFVRKNFGDNAIEFLKKYPDVKRNGGRKT